jgi:hypothetical protein
MPRERLSEPGEEEERPGPSRWAIGCGVGCLAVVLIGGAIGIGVGAFNRFGSSIAAGDEDTGATNGEHGDEEPTVIGSRDSLAEMERRYHPGPFVRLESLVPAGHLLPPTTPSSPLPAGRTIDNPWVVPGGGLEPTPMPGSSAGGPSVWHDPNEAVGRPLSVVSRAPQATHVRAQDANGGTNVVEYLVEFVGYQGHFRLPATVMTELGQVSAGGSDGATIRFALATAIRPGGGLAREGETFPVTMRIAAVDDQHRVSQAIERQLMVVAVGTGDVEITLWMSQPTDLDLYVVDPAVTIYYGNTSSFSGGQLDLDANAACSNNLGVDSEHIFWPHGRAPAGSYSVHVANFESCIENAPLDYRVTISACGETVVLSGHFDGEGNPGACDQTPNDGDRTWCQQVVRFDLPGCKD